MNIFGKFKILEKIIFLSMVITVSIFAMEDNEVDLHIRAVQAGMQANDASASLVVILEEHRKCLEEEHSSFSMARGKDKEKILIAVAQRSAKVVGILNGYVPQQFQIFDDLLFKLDPSISADENIKNLSQHFNTAIALCDDLKRTVDYNSAFNKKLETNLVEKFLAQEQAKADAARLSSQNKTNAPVSPNNSSKNSNNSTHSTPPSLPSQPLNVQNQPIKGSSVTTNNQPQPLPVQQPSTSQQPISTGKQSSSSLFAPIKELYTGRFKWWAWLITGVVIGGASAATAFIVSRKKHQQNEGNASFERKLNDSSEDDEA